jgi:hypothetical protein
VAPLATPVATCRRHAVSSLVLCHLMRAPADPLADLFKAGAEVAGMIGQVNSMKTALSSTISKRTPPGAF